ncbi:MAG TPA: hypothetical protein DCF68_21665, partial [Cyanothece sp. UBA12306]|nr:hypothetical protein [Cyanothece sp. UBA12306]
MKQVIPQNIPIFSVIFTFVLILSYCLPSHLIKVEARGFGRGSTRGSNRQMNRSGRQGSRQINRDSR